LSFVHNIKSFCRPFNKNRCIFNKAFKNHFYWSTCVKPGKWATWIFTLHYITWTYTISHK